LSDLVSPASQREKWVPIVFGLGLGLLVPLMAHTYLRAPLDLGWFLVTPMAFITVVVLAPILEEWCFRGWLWQAIDRRIRSFSRNENPALSRLQSFGLTVTNLYVTILFSGFHLLTRDLETAILVFLPSLYLGLVRHHWGRWGPACLLHGFWNYCWFAGPATIF
jgi:membrane protease YdiL (CAAX protease family)